MTEKEHHIFGGSSADIWPNCYGWASLMKDYIPEEAGAPADRGTALHTGVLEMKLKQELEYKLQGTPVELDYSGIKNWPEEGPELAEDFWTRVWDKVFEGFVTGKVFYIEKKLMLSEELDSGGTADLVALYNNDKGKMVGVVLDCKFGKHRVEPDKEQLKFYLVALNKIAKEKGKQIEEFKSFVYQPEHFEPLTDHSFTKSEIERAEAKYLKAIAESKKEKPKFKVGEWCKWCKVKGRCVTQLKHQDEQMQLTVIRNQSLNTVEFKDVETIPDETLAKIFLFSDKAVDFFKACKKEVVLRFANDKAGELKKYLKIVQSKTNSKIKDPVAAAESFVAMGVHPYKAPEMKGLGDLTKELAAVQNITQAKAKEKVYAFTEKPEGGPKVTTIDDPKPEYIFADKHNLLDGLDSDDSES